MFIHDLPKRFSKRGERGDMAGGTAMILIFSILFAIILFGLSNTTDPAKQQSIAECIDAIMQKAETFEVVENVSIDDYRIGTEPFKTLNQELKSQADSISNNTLEQACNFAGVDVGGGSDIEVDDDVCGGSSIYHYKSTPDGFALFGTFPRGCLLFPGDVCIDMCGDIDDFIALHDKCVDISNLDIEAAEGDLAEFTPRFVEDGVLPNECAEENQFSYDDFETVEELLLAHNPIMVIRSGNEWIRLPIPFEKIIKTPEETPRPAASCTIGGQTREHGPTSLVLYRKKDQYNLQNCEPQAQRAKLSVVCNDGKLIADGDREITADELNTYSLVYEPCDCNSPAGLIAHANSRTFYAKPDDYNCVNNAQACPGANIRCNDKNLEGPAGYNNPTCVNQSDRCLNNMLSKVNDATLCSTLMKTAVLDHGGKSLCEVVGSQIHGANSISKINGDICEIRGRLTLGSSKSKNGKGIKEYYGDSLQHFHSSWEGSGKSVLKASSSLSFCTALGRITGTNSNRLIDTTQNGNADQDVAHVMSEIMKFGTTAGGLRNIGIADVFRKAGVKSPQVRAEIWKSDHWVPLDFLACSSSCFQVHFVSFNSPIMISLNGLMPKGVIDARFSYDGKTVVDTKWPIFDASEPIGFLAYDFNGNGVIDDGTELFGEYTGGERFQHGYDALSYFFDGNGDGIVTGTELEGLMMWKDINGDGKGSADELSSILSYGITELDSGKNTDAARIEMEGGHASPVSLERGVVWTDKTGAEVFGASFDVWYLKKED